MGIINKFGMKTRALIITFALALLLFNSGCSGLPAPGDGGASPQFGGFLGGNEGVFPRIIQGAPPEVILDKGRMPFSFVMTLENIGETKIGTGTDSPFIAARLVGFRPSDFSLTPETSAKKLDISLEHAKRNLDGSITPGEISEVTWDNMAYVPRVDGPSAGLTLRAELCYDYESMATTKFCMKNDVIESAEDLTICSLKGPREFGNSGAPLHATNFEQTPMGSGKIQLAFTIEHFGRGVYFFRNTPKDLYDACVFSDLDPNIYKVEVFVEPVQKDLYTLDCSRFDKKLPGGGMSGVVKTQAGAPAKVTCFVTRNRAMEQRVYEDVMSVKLRYRYGEFVEVPILVQGYP